jgi:hypothetical protein
VVGESPRLFKAYLVAVERGQVLESVGVAGDP